MTNRARCLETRRTEDGFVRRRYEQGQVRWSTIEVPLDLWRQVNGQGRNRNRAAAVMRQIEKSKLKAKAYQLENAGWKTIAIASELGKPVRTIQRWLKNATPGAQDREYEA